VTSGRCEGQAFRSAEPRAVTDTDTQTIVTSVKPRSQHWRFQHTESGGHFGATINVVREGDKTRIQEQFLA